MLERKGRLSCIICVSLLLFDGAPIVGASDVCYGKFQL